MLIASAIRFLARKFQRLPPVQALLEREFEQYFATCPFRVFRGVYHDFAEAERCAPKTAGIGFDLPDAAKIYNEKFIWIFPSDYPAMLWLSRAFRDSSRIFDYGGNVGISFYSFRKYLDYPPNLDWTVCEVPAVVENGKKLAREQGHPELKFTSDFADADGTEILFASGAVQFIETPLHVNLARLKVKPRHIIINRLPLRDGPHVVTLQSIGSAFCPNHIFNATEFIESITALGYELIDRWRNPDFAYIIPFHPDESVREQSGLYFRQKAGA